MNFTNIYNKMLFIKQENKEHLLFLPANKTFQFRASVNCDILVFRLLNPISLCDGYPPEMLYKEGIEHFDIPDYDKNGKFSKIEPLPPIAHFLEGINMGITNGMKCRCWFDLKIKELFMLLRVYYPKKILYEFLYPAINGDMEFSAKVLNNWRQYPSVKQLASFMNLSTRQLSARFIGVFGVNPGKWIIREKAKLIHHEIICTTKSFSEMAVENGFATESVFTSFCVREFGKNPSTLRLHKK